MRKVWYELADGTMFDVSMASAKGWHVFCITRCRGTKDKGARRTDELLKIGRTWKGQVLKQPSHWLHLFPKLERKLRNVTSSLGAPC